MTTETPKQALRILLVEDDNHIGRIIELALSELGLPHQFVSVLSAKEGLDQWQRKPFDLLMTDYNLRGMNGLELIEELKNQGSTSPMMLVTAYDSLEVRTQARALGVAAYVTKPFFMEDLLNSIRELLPTQHETREVNGGAPLPPNEHTYLR